MSAPPAALRRIANALTRIQEAQGQLELAMAELGTLRHIRPTFTKGHKHLEQIRALWYQVEALRQSSKPITTDSEPEAAAVKP